MNLLVQKINAVIFVIPFRPNFTALQERRWIWCDQISWLRNCNENRSANTVHSSWWLFHNFIYLFQVKSALHAIEFEQNFHSGFDLSSATSCIAYVVHFRMHFSSVDDASRRPFVTFPFLVVIRLRKA